MISLHTGSAQTLTKLTILQEAVNVITTLEQQLRGSFLCLYSGTDVFLKDVYADFNAASVLCENYLHLVSVL